MLTINREFIINHFTKNLHEYKKYAKNIAGADDADDLFQECSLMLLEFNEERLIGYWNKTEGLKPFFLRMLQLQYKSGTSKYHKEYRKQEQFIQKKGAEIVYNDQQLEAEPEIDFCQLLNVRGKVHAFNGEMFPSELEELIFNLYVETGSLRKTLFAIPEEHAAKFDLKRVHEIVKKFRRTIKRHYDKAL
jgi:DNA-directed RNA polymerase specialized sigma24 family protein